MPQNPDAIIVYGGYNGAGRNQTYESAFRAVVNAANGKPIYFCTLLHLHSVDRRDLNRKIDNEINPTIRGLASGNVHVIDMARKYQSNFGDNDFRGESGGRIHLKGDKFAELWGYLWRELTGQVSETAGSTGGSTMAVNNATCDNTALTNDGITGSELTNGIRVFQRLMNEPMLGVESRGATPVEYRLRVEEICGMLGNFCHENLSDPSHIVTNGEYSYGFMGWNDEGGGWKFEEWMRAHNKDYRDLDAQIDFLLKNTESPNSILRNMQWIKWCRNNPSASVETIAKEWACHQEVCAGCCDRNVYPNDCTGNRCGNSWVERVASAKAWFEWYNRNRSGVQSCISGTASTNSTQQTADIYDDCEPLTVTPTVDTTDTSGSWTPVENDTPQQEKKFLAMGFYPNRQSFLGVYNLTDARENRDALRRGLNLENRQRLPVYQRSSTDGTPPGIDEAVNLVATAFTDYNISNTDDFAGVVFYNYNFANNTYTQQEWADFQGILVGMMHYIGSQTNKAKVYFACNYHYTEWSCGKT